MKRPSFQFYPDDWTGNSNLRRCTHEEKGIWMDVLCVLHDQEEYGIVRWSLSEIAQAVGTTKAKLKKLVDKGILKGVEAGGQCNSFVFVPRSGRKDGAPVTLIEKQEGPLWYSSRMVVDEHKRRVRGGLDDAPKGAPDHAPKPPIGEGIDDAPKQAPKGAPDHSPLAGAPGQAPRAAPSSPSPSPIKPSVPTGVGTGVPPAGPDDDDPPVDPPAPPAEPPGLTPQEYLFQVALPWLTARGMREASARSLLGGAVKQLGPADAQALVAECIRQEVLEPAAWLSKALNERIAARAGPGGGRRKGSRADERAAWNAELNEVLAEGGRAEKDMGVIDVSDR